MPTGALRLLGWHLNRNLRVKSYIFKRKLYSMSHSDMNWEQKLTTMTRNLQEVLGNEKLVEIIRQRPLKLYWGTATTGRPHLAYFVPISKIADFLSAGCEVTILIADLHGFLDNMKSPWELLKYRSEYYEHIIKAMLLSLNVNIEKLKFVLGSSYQLEKDYIMDMFKLFTIASEHDCKKAGSEVVKQVEHPLMSGLIYPGLQALDEEYLKVDAQFGGVDQRKIFTFAEKYMPMMGYEKRIHFMNPMVPGLCGSKMSSSDEDSKIGLLDDQKSVVKKIKKAFCEAGNITDNGLLAFCKHVIFTVFNHHPNMKEFVLKRSPENGGDVTYIHYDDLERDFMELKVHPGDLKEAVASYIDMLLSPVREYFSTPEMTELIELSYPSPKPVSKIDSSKKSQTLLNPSVLQLKVGQIRSLHQHPTLKTHYVMDIFVGDLGKRTLCSALVNHYKPEDLINRLVVVVCNPKESNFKGVPVDGQTLAVSFQNGSETQLELFSVPKECLPGDLVYVEKYSPEKFQCDYAAISNNTKKNFDKILDEFHVSNDGMVLYEDSALITPNGPVTSSVTIKS